MERPATSMWSYAEKSDEAEDQAANGLEQTEAIEAEPEGRQLH